MAIEGKPDQNLKVGSSYSIPAGAVHYAKVSGDETLKVLCVFIVDKTKPVATVVSPGPLRYGSCRRTDEGRAQGQDLAQRICLRLC